MINNTSVPTDSIYYLRTSNPNNIETWTCGSFTTDDVIPYQNDALHRVMVTAYSTGNAGTICSSVTSGSLGTKDSRAKASFGAPSFLTSDNLPGIWAEDTTTGLGSANYTPGGSPAAVHGNIALVFNLGTIPANDSISFNYVYIFHGIAGIDSLSALSATKMVAGAPAFALFPNRSSGKVVLQYEGIAGGAGLTKVSDMPGREALTAAITFTAGNGTAELDAAGLSSGLYIPFIQVNGVRDTTKLELRK